MRRWPAILLAAALSACIPPPIRPAGLTRPIDLDACYLWPNEPANDGSRADHYFILGDGSSSFKSVRWARDLDAAQDCDFAFTIHVSGLAPVWHSRLYALPSRREVAQVEASGANFSNLALAIYHAVEPGTRAYRLIKFAPAQARPAPAAEAAPEPAAAEAAPAPAQAPAETLQAPEPEIHAPRPRLVTAEEATIELLP